MATSAGSRRRFVAVLFDIGGVVCDSPFAIIARYEKALGFAPHALNRVFAGDDSCAFARLERGELSLERFYESFETECKAAGLSGVNSKKLFEEMSRLHPRPQMLNALQSLRKQGFKVGAITNNWKSTAEGGTSFQNPQFVSLFDTFVESAVVGMRKPDKRIFELACSKLNIQPNTAVFLDDIGRNLKPAKELGMETILVKDADSALQQLQQLLGISFSSKL